MNMPTAIGDLTDAAIREVRRNAMGTERNGGACPLHPHEDLDACANCAAEARFAESRRAEAIAAATDGCDSKFPARYRDAVTDRADVLAWVDQFQTAKGGDVASLLLLGPTGTGKTYQGYAALRAAVTHATKNRAGMYRPPTWDALTYADLCASLRPRGRDYDAEKVLARYCTASLLLIDDLGAAKASEAVEEVTYRLLNARYNEMRPMIITSNLAMPQLKDAIGDRIASRLAETCTRIVLAGGDRRRRG